MGKRTTYKHDEFGVEYYRESHLHEGGWCSREKNVQPGTVRVIDDALCKAWSTRSKGWLRKPEILWVPVRPREMRDIYPNLSGNQPDSEQE